MRTGVLRFVQKLGVTRRQLADEIGADEHWLGRWLNKRGRAMDAATLYRFHAYLQRLRELIDETEQALAITPQQTHAQAHAPPPASVKPKKVD